MTGDFRIASGLGGYILNCKQSNVAVYNSALTSSQVSTLFNFGTPETAISFSPQAWWKLNDQTAITDSSGNGNTGTNNGATDISSGVAVVPSWKIPDASGTSNGVSTTLPSTALQQSDLQFDSPYSNYSLSFDGVSSYIDTNFAIPNWTKYAYSIWFKFNGSSIVGYDHLIGNLSGGANANGRAIIGFTGTNLYLNMGDETNYWYDVSYSAAPLLDGSWHHIVLNVYETGQDIYVDGSLLKTYTYTGSVTTGTPATSNNFINKSGNFSSGNGAISSVDEHSVFNRLLTPAEILYIYNNGIPNDITSLSPSYWWRLGENAYFNDVPAFTVPNSITGAPNGTGSGSITSMISADAPGTYANGIGTNLAILDRVGDAALSTSNSQSYNMIPSDISPYVPQYVGKQIANNFSMTFDGANDYIDTGHTFSGDKWSYSYWVNISDPGNNSYFYHVTARNSSTQGLIIFSGNGSVSSQRNFTVKMNSTTITFSVASFATWYNIVITGDGSNLTAYVDGTQVATTAISTLFPTINYTTKIGSNKDGSLYFFNGQIDEVAIFDTALNAGQIYNDIYQPTSTGTNQTADFVNNPNLPNPVAWYRMGD
jgi:hypothetical protein